MQLLDHIIQGKNEVGAVVYTVTTLFQEFGFRVLRFIAKTSRICTI